MSTREEIESILSETPLYFSILNMHPFTRTGEVKFKDLPKMEAYELAPKSNYVLSEEAVYKMIQHTEDSARIYLEDVLINGTATTDGTQSSYDLEVTQVVEENDQVRIEGLLTRRIEFLYDNVGPDWAGSSFSGHVKEIQRGPPPPKKIELPPFDF